MNMHDRHAMCRGCLKAFLIFYVIKIMYITLL